MAQPWHYHKVRNRRWQPYRRGVSGWVVQRTFPDMTTPAYWMGPSTDLGTTWGALSGTNRVVVFRTKWEAEYYYRETFGRLRRDRISVLFVNEEGRVAA
jgi:hypothetical protein